MNLDADDLLAQVRQDWPVELEISTLRLLTERLQTENERLAAENGRLTASQVQMSYSGSAGVRPYVGSGSASVLDEDPARHG